jgi:hypothetical protein
VPDSEARCRRAHPGLAWGRDGADTAAVVPAQAGDGDLLCRTHQRRTGVKLALFRRLRHARRVLLHASRSASSDTAHSQSRPSWILPKSTAPGCWCSRRPRRGRSGRRSRAAVALGEPRGSPSHRERGAGVSLRRPPRQTAIGRSQSWAEALDDIGWIEDDPLVSSTPGFVAQVFLESRTTKTVPHSPVAVIDVPRGRS